MYSYNCVDCGKERFFKHKNSLEKSLSLHSRCVKCYRKQWNLSKINKRDCPRCGTTILYINYATYTVAEFRGSLCDICHKKRFEGSNNPFYGKTHSEDTRKKLSSDRKGKKRSEEYKAHLKELFKDKPRTGGRSLQVLVG